MSGDECHDPCTCDSEIGDEPEEWPEGTGGVRPMLDV